MKNSAIQKTLASLGVKSSNPGVSTGKKWIKTKGPVIESYSPVDGALIGSVQAADEKSFHEVIAVSKDAFKAWRKWPAPRRGEVVRQIGEALRVNKDALGK